MARREQLASFRVDGIEATLKTLEKFKGSVQRKILKKGLRKAATPVVKTARRLTPLGPGVDTKGQPRPHLRSDIVKKVFTMTRVGGAGVVIGWKHPQQPHAHLLTQGTQPHEIQIPAGSVVRLANRTLHGPFTINHPGAQPNPVLKTALRAQQNNVERILAAEFAKDTKKEAAKLGLD